MKALQCLYAKPIAKTSKNLKSELCLNSKVKTLSNLTGRGGGGGLNKV